MKGRPCRFSAEQANKIRSEYVNSSFVTTEYLADKYECSTITIHAVLNNKTHPDPNYIKPIRKGSTKKMVFIPPHLREIKETLVPGTQTAHRARGSNYVINKFS